MSAPVKIDERGVGAGKKLAVATLDVPATLNSLSLPMIEILAPAFSRWERDPSIVAVVLKGAGRAFAAGGDVQALYASMTKNLAAGRRVDDYAETFFEREYRLDYQMHRFPKPLIALGHGIVMGGGLGLFSASQYRVVTETSRIAMPEVTIGLFPDAGATWILRSLAPQIGLFLGITGSHLNATDALHINLATHAVPSARLADLETALGKLPWRSEPSDRDVIARMFAEFRLEALPEGPLKQLDAELRATLPARAANAGVASDAVRALAGRHAWIDRGIATLDKGCPTSVGIVVEQLARAGAFTLADSFRFELVVATHCARRGEFAEGVRALLIDKDNAPKWRYANTAALPDEVVAAHLQPPWPDNPLADLA
jgi:enoyl-CoA hydratase/carnithine racemase